MYGCKMNCQYLIPLSSSTRNVIYTQHTIVSFLWLVRSFMSHYLWYCISFFLLCYDVVIQMSPWLQDFAIFWTLTTNSIIYLSYFWMHIILYLVDRHKRKISYYNIFVSIETKISVLLLSPVPLLWCLKIDFH